MILGTSTILTSSYKLTGLSHLQADIFGDEVNFFWNEEQLTSFCDYSTVVNFNAIVNYFTTGGDSVISIIN